MLSTEKSVDMSGSEPVDGVKRAVEEPDHHDIAVPIIVVAAHQTQTAFNKHLTELTKKLVYIGIIETRLTTQRQNSDFGGQTSVHQSLLWYI